MKTNVANGTNDTIQRTPKAGDREIAMSFGVCVGVVLLLLLSACAPGAPPLEAVPTESPAPRPTRTAIRLPATWTPTATFTATPQPPPSATPSPFPTPLPIVVEPTGTPDPRRPVLNPVETLSVHQLQNSDHDHLHDLILFTSQAGNPLVGTKAGVPSSISPSGSLYAGAQLWAFSPDGLRAGRLTSQEQALVAYWPDQAGEKILLVQERGVFYNHPRLQVVELPGECYGELAEDEQGPFQSLPCAGFQWSPGGRTLGFFFGPEICGRGIILMNTLTGEVEYRSGVGGGFSFEFLRDGKALLSEGHCEGGTISLFDPLRREKTVLGEYGQMSWNVNRSALAVVYGVYGRMDGGVWVFDALVDQLVKAPPAPAELEREDHPVWSRSGRYLLFQRRAITDGEQEVTFDGERQVLRLDMQSGEITLLAGEDGYDYHLCADNQSACPWYGGVWQQVRRAPFKPATLPYFGNSELDCYLNGTQCDEEPETFALNVETGEMIPWKEAGYSGTATPAPTATPTPVAVGPDYRAGPVYRHPLGYYAFYPGLDGRSLWLAPQEGQPVLWVEEGEGFVYLP